MQTLASVLVATGHHWSWASRSDRVGAQRRVGDRAAAVLDAAQTLPAFVYLIPAIALFDPSRFTAIVAAVIYAVPPVIRLVDAGIRAVSLSAIEAATANGATGASCSGRSACRSPGRPSLLAANQGIVLVLAMVVVGGLVGAGALGYDVITGFSQREDFGKGFAAGIAIVLLGIMLDRITQGAGRRRLRITGAG